MFVWNDYFLFIWYENSCAERRGCDWPGFISFVIGALQRQTPSVTLTLHPEPHQSGIVTLKEGRNAACGFWDRPQASWGGWRKDNRGALDHKETTKGVSDPTGSTHHNPPPIHNVFSKRSGTQVQFIWPAGLLNWFDWLKAPLSRCAWGICLGAVTVDSALIFRREKWIGQNFIPAVNSGDNGALGGQGWPRRLTHSLLFIYFPQWWISRLQKRSFWMQV